MNASTSRLPRRARLLPLAGAVAALFAGPAAAQTAPALPVLANTGQPVNVQVRTAPGQMIVTTTQSRTVIPWASFNVAAGNSVSFKQPDASSAVLNRVITPGTPSTIDGAIDSNGKVYLLNPAGISFGVNSAVSVGALVASTLDMADSDFLNGVDRFRGAPGNGAVVHQGEIVTDTGGSVVLLGSSVTSTGAIRTSGGDVVLAASSADTLLGLANQHLTIDVGNTPAGAVRLGGTLDTSAALGDAGKVTVLASRVELGADLAILSDRQDPAGKRVQVEVRNSTLNVAAQDGTLSGTDASRLLQMADLKLAGTSASDLVVGDAIAWPAPQGASHALTLSSGGNLLVRNRIDATANGAAGSVALEIGQAQPAAGNTATDDFGLSATGFAGRIDLPSGTSFSTRLGSDGSTQVFTVINTPAQLRAAPATNTALGADITWPAAPGASFNPLVKRSGQYDGLGHSVWGLNVVDTGLSPTGMFSQLANSEVRNLALRQPTVQCTVYCGVLAGSTSRAGIRSVWVDGATVNAVTGSYFDGYYDNPVAVQYVGGIVGILGGSSITGSIVSSLTLTAPDNARDLGGVAGFTIGSWELRFGSPNVFFPTTIADTLADRVRIRTGNDMQFLGGLVGENRDATLSRVSASNVSIDTLSTTVSGSGMNAIGGLVGANGGTIDKASGAYVALTVGRNTSGVGGMVGSNGGLVTDSRVDAVVLNIGPMDAGAGVPSAIGGFAGMGGSNLYTGTPGSISGSAATNIRMNSSAGLVGVGGFIGVSTDNHAISRSTVND
ncbi:filamentous hemagglutinin N-terminal domain-containing protein, partial [Ramlibacter aquaticus]